MSSRQLPRERRASPLSSPEDSDGGWGWIEMMASLLRQEENPKRKELAAAVITLKRLFTETEGKRHVILVGDNLGTAQL